VALVVATTILMKMGRLRWIWVTMIPMAALIIITMTASYQKIFSPNPRIGFLSGANELAAEISSGAVAAARVAETHRLMFNLRLDAAVTDRKSTRLNSSHDQISYAVFCLKKKKKHIL